MTDSERLRLEVVVPVYNEQATLERSIRTLYDALGGLFDEPWQITIADNASTDATSQIADRLSLELPNVAAIHLLQKGRGRALKRAWLDSDADVVAYLDEDLSTDLRALPPLVAPLLSGHSDLAIGTRLSPGSRVVRGPRREFISRSYNLLLRRYLGVTFTDAQCGFKAMRQDVAKLVLPHVRDDGWFFDTELLVIAERAGLRIHEVPVDWIDDSDSSVDIADTAIEDLKGMVRVGHSIATGRIPLERIYAELGRHPLAEPRVPSFFGQVVRFGLVGVASTIAFALLYLLFDLAMPGQPANFFALLVTAVANTAVNRRFTFGVRGRRGVVRHQFQGLIVFGIAWAMTSGSLALLHAVRPDASALASLLVLTAANLLATLVRFVLLRVWVFRRQRQPADAGDVSIPFPHDREPLTTREALIARLGEGSQKASA
ncbi:glycosyltransferase [Lysinimonas soli]|uniref:dolichyl-phosphate beta-glucosyltransferase n=1 Tax=Lysinimonas soli TaxID=1074233 RepID=A0ABW0NSE8_9MICO